MQNVSDPVTVHFEVAITQLANVVSATRPWCGSRDALLCGGQSSSPTLLPRARGKHGDFELLYLLTAAVLSDSVFTTAL